MAFLLFLNWTLVFKCGYALLAIVMCWFLYYVINYYTDNLIRYKNILDTVPGPPQIPLVGNVHSFFGSLEG